MADMEALKEQLMNMKRNGKGFLCVGTDDPEEAAQYDLINWLVKRFDKQFKGDRVKYTYESGYARNGNIDEEYCIYTFVY